MKTHRKTEKDPEMEEYSYYWESRFALVFGCILLLVLLALGLIFLL